MRDHRTHNQTGAAFHQHMALVAHDGIDAVAFSELPGVRANSNPIASFGPSRSCLRDALDQVQSRKHEHLFRLSLDTNEAALLEFP